jgi:hypothetical protein
VADQLSSVSTHHGSRGGLVAGRFGFIHERGTGSVAGAIGDEDHGTGNTSLAGKGSIIAVRLRKKMTF